MKKLICVICLLLAAALCVGCAKEETITETTVPMEAAATEPASTQPEQAPDFTVVDGEGNEVRLSDYFGKPVVVNFWATWCGPCKSELPDFDAACAELDGDVQFMMINLTDGEMDTVEGVKTFIEDNGYMFPVFYDTAYNAASVYGVSAIPLTLFIDADGVLQGYANQAIDAETLQRGIDLITGK